MNTRSIVLSSIASAAAFGTAAVAEYYAGTGGAVADNNATGNVFSINVADSVTVSGVTVTLANFQHAYVGDLVITLTHVPSGATVTLLDRVGRTTTAASNYGDSSNLNGTYSFADGGSSFWSAAAAVNQNQNVASGTYAAVGSGIGSTVAAGPAAASLGSVFGGTNAFGEWQLRIKDLAAGDVANSNWTWSLEVATIPVPGVLALLGIAGFARFRRRS